MFPTISLFPLAGGGLLCVTRRFQRRAQHWACLSPSPFHLLPPLPTQAADATAADAAAGSRRCNHWYRRGGCAAALGGDAWWRRRVVSCLPLPLRPPAPHTYLPHAPAPPGFAAFPLVYLCGLLALACALLPWTVSLAGGFVTMV